MALLDKVPGELKLYIGGLFTLRRREALQQSGITHVLSVLKLPLDQKLFEGFAHKVVEVDDVDDENLIEHFPACVRFIHDGLDAGGGVLVHCLVAYTMDLTWIMEQDDGKDVGMAEKVVRNSIGLNLDADFADLSQCLRRAMGKSRSATVVCAYLMHSHAISPSEALAQIRKSRPFCEPNDGFMKQLQLYHEMSATDNVEETPAYQRWLYQREVESSRACGQAPEAEKIRFEDEHVHDAMAAEFELRCRKCRRPLATSEYLVRHQPRRSSDKIKPIDTSEAASAACAHYFLDPLSWMRLELEQGKLDGRLECPKCKTNVGRYAWQGMQCSCGDWIVPGISLAKGRIDEAKLRPQGSASMGIRMPPSVAGRRPSGQENL